MVFFKRNNHCWWQFLALENTPGMSCSCILLLHDKHHDFLHFSLAFICSQIQLLYQLSKFCQLSLHFSTRQSCPCFKCVQCSLPPAWFTRGHCEYCLLVPASPRSSALLRAFSLVSLQVTHISQTGAVCLYKFVMTLLAEKNKDVKYLKVKKQAL